MSKLLKTYLDSFWRIKKGYRDVFKLIFDNFIYFFSPKMYLSQKIFSAFGIGRLAFGKFCWQLCSVYCTINRRPCRLPAAPSLPCLRAVPLECWAEQQQKPEQSKQSQSTLPRLPFAHGLPNKNVDLEHIWGNSGLKKNVKLSIQRNLGIFFLFV